MSYAMAIDQQESTWNLKAQSAVDATWLIAGRSHAQAQQQHSTRRRCSLSRVYWFEPPVRSSE
jgi:hypothetical protein